MISPRELVPPFIVATLALNTMAVGLRLYVRLFITKAVGLDDLALVLAFILLVLYCTTMWAAIAQGYAADDPEDIRNPVMAVKFFVVSSIFYILTLCFTKLSSALVLYRLATTRRPIQRLLAVTGSIILIWGVVGTALIGLQCRPLSIVWGETPKSEGICLPPYVMSNLGVSLAALDIVSAFLFAILPVSLLRRVQLPLSVKISVIILLGLGTLTSIITVLRMKCVVDIAALKDTHNGKAESLFLRIHAYTVPEMGLALFTATIVALPPLIKLIFQGGLESLGASNTKGAPRTRASRKPDIALYGRPGWSDQFCAGSEENIIRDADGPNV
ncbi:hypothetical protein RB595_007250 [Gaeumannomyces hyphopodioides]